MAGIPYFSIVPCCSSSGTATGFFNFPPAGGWLGTGTYVYYGSTVTINGITFTAGYCYTITGVGISLTDYADAPIATNFNLAANCSDALCYDCETPPPPVPKCFQLFSCNGDVIVTDTNLLPYINTFITLVGKPGCWFVSNSGPKPCNGPNVQTVTPDPDVPCECDCKCYQVTGDPTTIFYIDCNGVPQYISGTSKFCSLIPPVVTGGLTGSIYDFGLCVDGECPELCFEFTNCQTGQVLVVSNTPQITEYFVNNSVVTLDGYEGCWSIGLSQTCECPVNVTILQVFADCPSCLPVIAYQFTNCSNTSIVQYSTDDYSAYINKTVELGCGECWKVTQINFTPPTTQPIDIQYVYNSCAECNRVYYKLVDCQNLGNVQYTYSDLAAYVGQIITIENCDGCFSVEVTKVPINPGIVTVTESFEDCIDCGAIAPCVCTTVKNYDTVPHTYNYLDCNGILQTFTVLPGQVSDKACMRGFVGDKACNCIELTINGQLVTAVLQPNQINGKPVWKFVFNSLTYTIAYDTNEGWQLLQDLVPNGIAGELNNPMLPCPVGPWTIIRNPAINVSVYLDDSTFLFGGVFTYDYEIGAYFATLEYLGQQFQFIIDVTYFSNCSGVWQLGYYNTEHEPPTWDVIATWPADCTCLNGTYTDVNPSIIYIEVENMCTMETADCSVGYNDFVPAITDDIKQYGDCTSDGGTLCYTYIITIPPLPQGQTLYYKDCTGGVISQAFPNSKASVAVSKCGIPGQTASDIYLTGPSQPTFEQTIPCSEPTFRCPPPVYPKRPVIPGYSVPGCDIEKFEKFTCKSAEILYKTVMEKRYGISNCCPDTDLGDKWLVKKELADLQGATDPNYVCTPSPSCCDNTPTCGCGCNTQPRTCNSR